MGGIPLVTLISQMTGIPAVFVRKASKGHGTDKVIEGIEVAGKRVTIVEDVVTSGGQIVLSAADLRRAGAVLDIVVCAIDREQGGREALAATDLRLMPGWTMEELKAATADDGKSDPEEAAG